MNNFIWYKKCSTCRKAKDFLINNNIDFKERDIVEDKPTYDELLKWIKEDNIKKFFNTSGIKYRELKLKDKLDGMSYDEKIKLLSSDGMLIKRPIFFKDDIVLVGFKEKEWEVLKNEI